MELGEKRMKLNRILIIESLILMGFMLSMISLQVNANDKPAIYIKHRIDNATVRKGLQSLWKLCVIEKEMFQKHKNNNHPAWPVIAASLKKDRPDYDVDVPLAEIKKWSQYGIQFEEEYFYQDMYAIYKTSNKYKVSEDGRCSILIEKNQSANLDNGKFRYDVNIDKGNVVKFRSQVVILKENDKLIQSQEYEQAMVATASMLGSPKGALPQNVGSERVLGRHQCDYISFGNNSGSKLCYWSKMNTYPSIAERPIILKSKIRLGKVTNVKQAIVFEVKKKFRKTIFEPKTNLKIIDRSGM